jgi:hypothetical protein
MKKLVLLIATHVAALVVGFAVGVYVLPILTAPDAPSIDVSSYNTVIVWCESFGQFITAAKYQ